MFALSSKSPSNRVSCSQNHIQWTVAPTCNTQQFVSERFNARPRCLAPTGVDSLTQTCEVAPSSKQHWSLSNLTGTSDSTTRLTQYSSLCKCWLVTFVVVVINTRAEVVTCHPGSKSIIHRRWSARCVREAWHSCFVVTPRISLRTQVPRVRMLVASFSCDSTGEAVDLQPSVATAQTLTDANRHVCHQAAGFFQNGPGLCVDIFATHKWPLIGNPRSVDANAFDSVSTGSSLALTLAVSYHIDCTFRFSSSLTLTNFSCVLMLDDRASSEKTSGRRAWAEKTSCSPLRAMTMMMRRACQLLQKRTSSVPRQPTSAILDRSRLLSVRTAEMKIADTSPPNSTVFFLRHTNSTRWCSDQPQPLCSFQGYSRHQKQLRLLPPTSPQLQLCH